MSIKNARKEIVLTLVNSDATTDSTIGLFQSASSPSYTNNQGATATRQEIDIPSGDFPAGSAWDFIYNGGLTFTTASTPTSITALVTELNATFQENGRGIFTQEASATGFYLRCASNKYVFTQRDSATEGTLNFTDSGTGYISGTTTTISIGASGVTYDELVSELSTQPYMFTDIYISCETAAQLDNQFVINKLQPNGTAKIDLAQPLLDPNYSQLVNDTIPVYMPTSALNDLQYVIDAGETVKMVISYEHADLFDALSVMKDGNFIYKMKQVKSSNEKEYDRIMEMLHDKAWTQADLYNPILNPPPPVEINYHVPLIFSVLNQNKVQNIAMI
jgi:hypothetical protein